MKLQKSILSMTIVTQFLIAPLAGANYDRMVTWSDMSDIDLSRVLKSPYAAETNLFESAVSDSKLEVAIEDADHKIDSEFHVPTSMRKPVEFWLKVYTQYTTQQQVIFDSKHPDVIYEIVDFRDLAKSSRNAVVYEILREKRLKGVMAAYRRAFDHLAASARGAKKKSHLKKHAPAPEEIRILAALKKSGHHHTFRELRSNLKMQAGQRDNVMKGLLAAEAFFPRMEKIFSSMGIPPELTRLSLVESSFDLRAYSRMGAAGVWQLMRKPGTKLLTIDDRKGIDERRSPLKATVAAAKMLKENYVRFRSWPLAVTAYNHGLRGLMKFHTTKPEHGFRELAYLFEPCSKKYSPLGWAAKNYYAEYLAMLHAETYHELFYGEIPAVQVKPLAYRQIPKRETAMAFAMNSGVSFQDLRLGNPDIRNVNARLPAGYWIAVPGEADDLSGLTKPRSKRSIAVARLALRPHKT